MSVLVERDDTTGILKIFEDSMEIDIPNGICNLFMELHPGAIIQQYGNVSGNAHTAYGQHNILGVNATEAVTITLNNQLIDKQGFKLVIKDESGNASANNITIITEDGVTIDGGLTKTIDSDYGSLQIYSNGTNLFTF